MQTFYDYDPSNPFVVSNELQTITNGKIRLNYTPLKNSIVIPGFTQATTSSPGETEFYVDYQDSSEYRLATQYVYFSSSKNGSKCIISSNRSTSFTVNDLRNIFKIQTLK